MRRHLLPALLLALAACRASDPQSLVLVARDDFSAWPWATVGGGGASDLIAYSRPDPSGTVLLRVVRVDPLRPEVLEPVVDVPLDGAPPSGGISVTGRAVAVVAGTGVTIVEVVAPTGTQAQAAEAAPAGTIETGTFSITSFPVTGAERAVVDGGWVLVSSGDTLTLATRLGGSVSTFTAPARVTALLAAGGWFLAFTETGYVSVTPDPKAPAFVAGLATHLGGVRAAYRDSAGTGAFVAGPWSFREGWSRVLHLDLQTPGLPVTIANALVEGTFSAFAYDGGRTSVLRVADGSDDASGHVLHASDFGRDEAHVPELSHTFTVTGIPLPRWGRGPDEEPGLAARAGHLAALSTDGFGYYRLER